MPLVWPEDEYEIPNWKPQVCPRCGAVRGAEIVYGLPDVSSLAYGVKPRGYVLGGCMTDPDSPKWHCLACKHEWGKKFQSEPENTSTPHWDD